ncbi:pyruvate kinase [Raphidocelis subcapitata]|uniref:pyruvate kinase n=1 Tax=Raphidocelis subcapitata TaxID=307507 RepID=A0A2V0P5N9_9CHLO|nr:pyruvate kinase [Raphidocelis subcapitata]|eukprot:GBF94889.1 pyruvate kinase [Raphidocelis subcapitata]
MASGGGGSGSGGAYARRSLPAKPGGSAFRAPASMASLCTSTADAAGGAARPPATKICATIGPASHSVATLRAMLRAGMSLARINLTWGPLDFHRRTLENLQAATRLERRLCGVIVGAGGREVPVVGRPTAPLACGWARHTDALVFEAGQRVVVTAREGAAASASVLPIPAKEFVGHVSPGDVLHVGRYLTLGTCGLPAAQSGPSRQSGAQAAQSGDPCGQSEDASGQPALLTLRVLSVSPPDLVCEAANAAALSGLLTVSHPGAARRRRAAGGARAAAAERAAAVAGEDGDAWGAVAAPASDGGGGGGDGAAAFGCDPDSSANYSLPILSASDVAALKAGSLAAAFPDTIDFVAVSHARCAADVAAARGALEAAGLGAAGVAAEINTAAALGRRAAFVWGRFSGLLGFAEILDESNAVIINRGALGLEVPPEKLCPLQKALVLAANLVGKPVAINMLVDSMVDAPRPTRAEATDVANAVLDGVDALQCGAETLRGKYPVEVVATVARICREAELVFDHQHHYRFLIDSATAAQEAREESGDGAAYCFGGGPASTASPGGAPAHSTPSPGAGGGGAGRTAGGPRRAVRRAASAGGRPGSALGPLSVGNGGGGGGWGLDGQGVTSGGEGSDYDDSRVSSLASSPVHGGGAGGAALVHPSLLRRGGGGGGAAADGPLGFFAASPSAADAAAARPPRHPPAGHEHDLGLQAPAPAPQPAGGGMHKGCGSYADISTALRSMARGVGPSRLSGGGAANGGGGPGGGAAGQAGGADGGAGGGYGISPYDTPLGSPRGWRCPGPASLAAAAAAARGGGAPRARGPRGLGGRRGPASPSVNGGGAGGPPSLGAHRALALDPGRDLYPRLEAMAASAVRTALKVGASLIVVLSHTSTAARLVAKYRPAQPVLALMVPRLAVQAGVKWRLEGRGEARRCIMSRGLTPLLWVPHLGTSTGGAALDSAAAAALRMGLVAPGGHIVCLERFSNSLGVQVIQAGGDPDASGRGSPYGAAAAGRPRLLQEFFGAARGGQLPGAFGGLPSGLPGVNVSQLVSSPSIMTPSALAAAFELLKADASAAASDAAGGGGAALEAAAAAAARARGPAAAAAAFGAVAADAAAPLGTRPSGAALAALEPFASPSPPHVGAFVIPPSPLVGFRSSQLPIRGPGAAAAAAADAGQSQLRRSHSGGGSSASGGAGGSAGSPFMPPIAEAPGAAAPEPFAPAAAPASSTAATAAAAATAAVAPGGAGGVGLGGAGAAALGGGLRGGVGVPLVPTLSSAVDDDLLMAALELLAPPRSPPQSGAGRAQSGAAGAQPGAGPGRARSRSEVGEGSGAGRGGGDSAAAIGAAPGLVRSLSDVQQQEAAAAAAAAARRQGRGPAEGKGPQQGGGAAR